MNIPTIIAEVKTESPFGFRSPHSWDYLFNIANEVGNIISVHTDPRWGGSLDLIKKARSLTSLPILAKGIHATDDEIIDAANAGASYILVVGRVPDPNAYRPYIYPNQVIIEPTSISQLSSIVGYHHALWNSRDLDTGGFKAASFEQARDTWSGWLCQASHIRTVEDIKPYADAVLVGEHLIEFAASVEENTNKQKCTQ